MKNYGPTNLSHPLPLDFKLRLLDSRLVSERGGKTPWNPAYVESRVRNVEILYPLRTISPANLPNSFPKRLFYLEIVTERTNTKDRCTHIPVRQNFITRIVVVGTEVKTPRIRMECDKKSGSRPRKGDRETTDSDRKTPVWRKV